MGYIILPYPFCLLEGIEGKSSHEENKHQVRFEVF